MSNGSDSNLGSLSSLILLMCSLSIEKVQALKKGALLFIYICPQHFPKKQTERKKKLNRTQKECATSDYSKLVLLLIRRIK